MASNPELELVADRTQLRLLRALAERDEASLGELAAAAGVHPNTARPRLRNLERAGMVERFSGTPRGRGRPVVSYRVAHDWRLPTTDFLGLAELLASVVLRTELDGEQLDGLGREWGRSLFGRPGSQQPGRALPVTMAQLGFDARLDRGRVVLNGCPCPLVMRGRPEVLCRLATAAMSGVLQAAGSDLRPADSKHDPARRVCSIRLRRGAMRSAEDG